MGTTLATAAPATERCEPRMGCNRRTIPRGFYPRSRPIPGQLRGVRMGGPIRGVALDRVTHGRNPPTCGSGTPARPPAPRCPSPDRDVRGRCIHRGPGPSHLILLVGRPHIAIPGLASLCEASNGPAVVATAGPSFQQPGRGARGDELTDPDAARGVMPVGGSVCTDRGAAPPRSLRGAFRGSPIPCGWSGHDCHS